MCNGRKSFLCGVKQKKWYFSILKFIRCIDGRGPGAFLPWLHYSSFIKEKSQQSQGERQGASRSAFLFLIRLLPFLRQVSSKQTRIESVPFVSLSLFPVPPHQYTDLQNSENIKYNYDKRSCKLPFIIDVPITSEPSLAYTFKVKLTWG